MLEQPIGIEVSLIPGSSLVLFTGWGKIRYIKWIFFLCELETLRLDAKCQVERKISKLTLTTKSRTVKISLLTLSYVKILINKSIFWLFKKNSLTFFKVFKFKVEKDFRVHWNHYSMKFELSK